MWFLGTAFKILNLGQFLQPQVLSLRAPGSFYFTGYKLLGRALFTKTCALFSSLKYSFIFTCVGVLPEYNCAPLVCLVPVDARRGLSLPGTWVADTRELPCGCWESHLLKEHPTLSATEPGVQPIFLYCQFPLVIPDDISTATFSFPVWEWRGTSSMVADSPRASSNSSLLQSGLYFLSVLESKEHCTTQVYPYPHSL